MTKQRCFQIPVGPGALNETDLCKLLAQHGIRYWVNDVAVETVHGITRPVYTLPPPEPGDVARYRFIRDHVFKDGNNLCFEVSDFDDLACGNLSEGFDTLVDRARGAEPASHNDWCVCEACLKERGIAEVDCTACPHPDACESAGGCTSVKSAVCPICGANNAHAPECGRAGQPVVP